MLSAAVQDAVHPAHGKPNTTSDPSNRIAATAGHSGGIAFLPAAQLCEGQDKIADVHFCKHVHICARHTEIVNSKAWHLEVTCDTF